MKERYAYVFLVLLVVALSVGTLWISVNHDKEDNRRFCDVVTNIVTTMKNPDPGDVNQEESYLRWVALGKSLGCR